MLAIKLLSFAPKKVLDARTSVASIRFEHTMMPVVHSDHTTSFRASSALFALGVVAAGVSVYVSGLVCWLMADEG